MTYFQLQLRVSLSGHWTVAMPKIKCFGERPQAFVGQYMRYHRGSLYKRFPQLWKRMATIDEKRKMQEMACPSSFLNTNIMLVRASEVDDILMGREEKYRAGGSSATPTSSVSSSLSSAVALNGTPMKTTRSGTGPWLGQQVQFRFH
ncbi:unnamed protein product [Gongylonema pulchrum]|uniref:SWI/SNF Subunit INI1 DNA binding domain-containing protein n=1 Tax=Gongylonema pulchrum TaxID=637853 RepID=A0A183EEF0_9BILA|nr:unnamed protein product [Gongylonema pulchrum]